MLIYVCGIVGEFDDTASKAPDLLASKSAPVGHTQLQASRDTKMLEILRFWLAL